jgi:hypothetical protein
MDMKLDADLRLLAGRLGWGCLAVIGAGLSLRSRYPTTALLEPLVWKAVDADREGRAELAQLLGQDQGLTAKALLAADRSAIDLAWALIVRSDGARRAFQEGFADLDRERSEVPSLTFDAVARLVHRRVIEKVVSLNWDTGVETAYRRLYGSQIPPTWLSKPHGDAAHPESDWVLPGEDRRLDPGLLAQVAALREGHPRTMLVVGYSESDEVIVDELIDPLAREWEVVRIGPSASGPLAVARPAEEILPPLAQKLCKAEEESPWHYLGFAEQRRGLAAALRGARLGPGDVKGCPRLPEGREVVDSLRAADAVVLRGESGGGKSITAYQALFDLNEEGFEIVRAADDVSAWSIHQTVQSLLSAPVPTVGLVDDAQAVSPDLLRRLAETASSDHKILIVSTDDVPGPAIDIRIAEQRAVAVLATDLLSRRQEVLPLIRELDGRIGEGYLDESLERRLELASQEELPWKFAFTLTGGWRRTRSILARLRDSDRLDLALLAVSVRQVASADAGATIDDLHEAAGHLGRTREWMDDAIERLLADRAITGGARIRTVHIQMAMAVIRVLLHPPRWPTQPSERVTVAPITEGDSTTPPVPSHVPRREPHATTLPDEAVAVDRAKVSSLLTAALDDTAIPLRGVLWLLNALNGAEVRWSLNRLGFPGSARLDRLAVRALGAVDPASRSTAAFLLAELLHWDKEATVEHLEGAEGGLAVWVTEVEPLSAYGLARLFNDLGQVRPDLTHRILAQTDPKRLARHLSNTDWQVAGAWAGLVDRLAVSGGPPFRKALAASLEPEPLRALFTSLPQERLYVVEELASAVYGLQPDLGISLVKVGAPQLADRISARPAETTLAIHEIFWWSLGMAPQFLRRRAPTAKQKTAARKLARSINTPQVAAAIARGTRRDWHALADLLVFVAEADPRTFEAVVRSVDRNDLDRATTGLWQAMPRELEQLLWVLSSVADGGVAKRLLIEHAHELRRLSGPLAVISPEAAVSVLQRGIPLDLGLAHHDWRLAASALDALYRTEREVARRLLIVNREALIRGLALKGSQAPEDLDTFLTVVDKYAPSYIDDVLADLRPQVITEWRPWLKQRNANRRVVARLAHRTGGGSGPAAEAAKALLNLYPSLRDAH